MITGENHPCARLRIVLQPGKAIGPGKADLLQGIQETGSIAAAGRRMAMSYKRAWKLTETLNTYFATPLVEAAKGGARGGGARLTPLGVEILALYRNMEHKTARALKDELDGLSRHLSRRGSN